MSKKHLGNISLIFAALVMIVAEAAIHLAHCQHWFFILLTASAEAATVGGIADWFAVTALFKPIPIPLLRRHTNILVANRAKFTEGAVDMVQNKWLSPPVIAKELERLSASQIVIEYFEKLEHREQLLETLRFLLARMADDLDRPEMTEFVSRVLKDQVRQADLAGALGHFLEEAFRRGDHERIWELLLESLETLAQNGTVHRQVKQLVHDAVRVYKEKGWGKKLFAFLAEHSGALDYEEIANSFTAQVRQFLIEAKNNPRHDIRKLLDEKIMEFAQRLTRGDNETCSVIQSIQANLVESSKVNDIINQLLQRFKGTLQQELSDMQSSLMQIVRSLFDRILNEFRSDSAMRNNVDLWVRQTVMHLVENNHRVIGEMVGKSLSALKDGDLVEQVQSKVWDDMQYIRLNGAVVGAMVGLMIAVVKLLLFTP